MAQANLEYLDIVNSFYLALENNQTIEELYILAEELHEFGVSESIITSAQQEATRLFSKNCF